MASPLMVIVRRTFDEPPTLVGPEIALFETSRSRHFLMATIAIEHQRHMATPFARVGVPGSQESNLNNALRLLAELSSALTGADGAAIALSQDGKVLVRAASGDIARPSGSRIDTDSTWSDLLLRRTLEPIFCVDTEKDSRVSIGVSRSMSVRSTIVLPLYGRGSLVGVLEVFWRAPYGFTNREIGSLTRIGELVVRLLKADREDAGTIAQMLHLGSHLTTTDCVAKPSKLKPVSPDDESDFEERQLATANSSLLSLSEQRVPAPLVNRIEVVITPNAVEEELTTLPMDLPIKKKSTNSRARYQWGVLAVLVLVVTLTTGVWWRVEASQTPPITSSRPSSVVVPNAFTNQGSGTDDGGKVAALIQTPSSAAPTAPTEALSSTQTQLSPSRITGIHYSSSDTGSTVTLDLEGQPGYQANTLDNPTRVFFDLQNTSMSPDVVAKAIPVNDMLVARIRSGRVGSATRIVFDAKLGLDFRVQMKTNPSRMIIDLRSAPEIR
jgi:hypothetical protein